MRSADISPPTEEARRREFIESADRALGPVINLAQIRHRVRVAMDSDRERGGAICAALCKALDEKNSPTG